MKKQKFLPLLSVAILISFSMCDFTVFDTETGDITGVDFGSDVDVEKEQVDKINEETGIDAQTEGDNPPDISGEYLTDSLEAVYDYFSADESEKEYSAGEFYFNSYYWKFDNFNKDDLTIEVSYSMVEGGDTANGKGYIVGDGDKFTVYVDIDGQTYGSYENIINYTFSYILAGTFNDGEITDFYFAYVCTDKSGDDYGDWMSVGDIRVTYERDGTVSEADYPGYSRSVVPGISSGELFKVFK